MRAWRSRTVFLTLVIPFALDERSTAGAWTLEGAGLVWIGFRQRRGLPRVFGYVLLVLAGLAMLLGHERHGVPTAVFNAYLFNGLMAAAASLAGAFFVHRAGRAGALQARRGSVRAAADRRRRRSGSSSTAAIEIDAFVPMRLRARRRARRRERGRRCCTRRSRRRLDWPEIAWPALAHAPIAASSPRRSPPRCSPIRSQGGGWWAWPIAFAVHALVLRLAAPRWPELGARTRSTRSA